MSHMNSMQECMQDIWAKIYYIIVSLQGKLGKLFQVTPYFKFTKNEIYINVLGFLV